MSPPSAATSSLSCRFRGLKRGPIAGRSIVRGTRSQQLAYSPAVITQGADKII
jgi:hypothetical protein